MSNLGPGKAASKSKRAKNRRRGYFCSGFYCAFQFSKWILVGCFNLQHLQQPAISIYLKLKCRFRPAASAVWNKLVTFVRDFWIWQIGSVESMSSTDSDLSEFANFFGRKFGQRPGSRAAGDISKKLANRLLIMNCNLCKIEPLDPIEGAFGKHKIELFCNYWKKKKLLNITPAPVRQPLTIKACL